jgi:hypothetical protein
LAIENPRIVERDSRLAAADVALNRSSPAPRMTLFCLLYASERLWDAERK